MKGSYAFALSRRKARPLRFSRLACCAVSVLLLPACASTVSAQQLTPTAVEVRVAHPPASVQAIGRQHLVYELHVTNFGGDSLRLEHLRVRDADHPATELASSGAGDVARRFWVVGRAARPAQPVVVLPPGARGVLYQWVTLAPQTPLPRALLHEFAFSAGAERRPDTLRTAPLPVAAGSPPSIEAPVGAGRWVTVRAPSNRSGHRRALVVLEGKARVPERFAVDWVRLGEAGRFFEGDPQENASWFSYDQPVLAAASGKVVLVRDGLPETPPLSGKPAVPFTPETVAGNTVVVDIGDGRFAVYAHLRPGSISVEEGASVQAGQEIGRIGNSGHSLAPHLHFHVEDRPDPLKGEGRPFALSSFELIGRLDSLPQALQGVPWTPHPARPARAVSQEIPLENMVVEIR